MDWLCTNLSVNRIRRILQRQPGLLKVHIQTKCQPPIHRSKQIRFYLRIHQRLYPRLTIPLIKVPNQPSFSNPGHLRSMHLTTNWSDLYLFSGSKF